MFKLAPFISRKIWGYEKWIVSTHPAGPSRIAEPAEGEAATERFLADEAGDYPLLVKIIQADDILSVQVHPDDEYALAHEHSLGKSECWYVLDAPVGASLICGLDGGCTPDEIAAAVNENRLEPLLKRIPVKKGDFVYIPAGVVHAIGKGLRLLEVQESSDITYRLYDWGRGREVHTDKALAVINWGQASSDAEAFGGAFKCPFFTLRSISVESGSSVSPSVITTDEKNFVLFVLEGSGVFASGNGVPIMAEAEDAVFCMGGETISLSGDMSVMRICLP